MPTLQRARGEPCTRERRAGANDWAARLLEDKETTPAKLTCVRVLSIAVSVLVTAAGCSLVVGTDGLSGEAPGIGPSDAASGDAPEVSLDGAQATDAPALDGGDAGLRGCALYPDATFCQDFDDPATALSVAPWSASDVGEPGGAITLVSAGAASPPNAARLALFDAGTGCKYIQLSKNFPGTFSGLTARLSVRPESNSNFLAVVAAPTSLPGASYRILVSFDKLAASKSQLYAFVQKYESGVFSDFSSGTIDYSIDPFGGQTFDVTVEMKAAPNASIIVREGARQLVLAAPPALKITSEARVDIGPYCSDMPATFTFDDVAVWAFP